MPCELFLTHRQATVQVGSCTQAWYQIDRYFWWAGWPCRPTSSITVWRGAPQISDSWPRKKCFVSVAKKP